VSERLKIREKVVEIGIKMLNSSLVVGTWGNISARVAGEDLVAITPSGMNYDSLLAEDIVLVDLAGNVVEGTRKPSIELPMHLAVYNNRTDIQAIVHTHSSFATAMAASFLMAYS
jgi:L-fuculose-phosphate aldolase